ncbi:MAG: flagellar motor protein MotB, partial [Rhodospirillaceae bacterium]|nr:flagellar motor protein MotB [Rhodospirillaceae bacterium]
MSLPPFSARRAGAQPDRTHGIWLITLTDLVGLMLAFFIMMYAMSKLDAERWDRLAASAGGDAAGARAAAQAGSEAPPPVAVPAPRRGRDSGYLAALLPQKLAAEPALAGAQVVPGPGRVAIVMPLDAVAEGVTTDAAGTAPGALAALNAVIAPLPNVVRVEASLRGSARKPQDW